MTYCWNCSRDLTGKVDKIGFRELCPFCDAYLHCCKNCVNYAPGLPNDCKVPDTDPISDRSVGNFCEEFKASGKKPPEKPSLEDIQKRLFK